MATFQRFEDIEAWKKASELTKDVYKIIHNSKFSKDYGLRDQICRASVSVMSNIADGFERDGTREFVQFLSVAKGSIGEIKSQLYVALDQEYIEKIEFERIFNEAKETGRIIGGLMQYLKKVNMKGIKYREN